jgi:uncharacterized protein involved in high-affinity Fe2+ transport
MEWLKGIVTPQRMQAMHIEGDSHSTKDDSNAYWKGFSLHKGYRQCILKGILIPQRKTAMHIEGNSHSTKDDSNPYWRGLSLHKGRQQCMLKGIVTPQRAAAMHIEGDCHSTKDDSNTSHLTKGRACFGGVRSTQYKPTQLHAVSSQVFVTRGEKWKQLYQSGWLQQFEISSIYYLWHVA